MTINTTFMQKVLTSNEDSYDMDKRRYTDDY